MLIFLLFLTAFVGSFVAGLLGGGAGLIMTPAIFWFLSYQNPHADYLMQTSIVTMVTALMLSGVVAIKKHHDYRHIDWQAVRYTTLWIIIGTLCGCWLMVAISSKQMNYVFAIATLVIACRYIVQMIQASRNAKTSKLHNIQDDNRTGHIEQSMQGYGTSIFQVIGGVVLGVVSTVSGAASFVVPYYEHLGLDIKKAIGTTTVVVWLYSIIVTIVMIISALSLKNLPQGNIGFLNYKYLLVLTLPTIPGIMLGAKLTSVLPEKIIRVGFIILLLCIAVAMLLK